MIERSIAKSVFKWFEEISKIPRRSTEEQKICAWIMDWAKKRNLETITVQNQSDTYDIIIRAPGTPGYESLPGVIIQAHIDMVCEKTQESNHDFKKDPIKLIYDGEWLRANQTTLGADNGIGVAYALAAIDEGIEHPPLELLFTVDEEIGLTGAKVLKPGILKGKYLINTDLHIEGVFVIGSAGCELVHLTMPIEYEDAPRNSSLYKLTVNDLTGGHSGLHIHHQRANASWILARVLYAINCNNINLAQIQIGTSHNAIPQFGSVSFYIPNNSIDSALHLIKKIEQDVKSEYKNTDPNLNFDIKPIKEHNLKKAISLKCTSTIINLIQSIPHGVGFLEYDDHRLVETSSNLAMVFIQDNMLKIVTHQRSSVSSRLNYWNTRIKSIGELAGCKFETVPLCPSWKPDSHSPIFEKCKEIYKKVNKKDLELDIIHGGLECAVIGDKYPEMQIVSLGPTLQYTHSPKERANIASIERTWLFIKELLKSFKNVISQ